MKTIITKIIALVFCSIIFASAIHAQEKPRAMEIGEFSGNGKSIQQIKEKIAEFSRRVAKESATTKGFIQIQADNELFEKVKSVISEVDLKKRILFEGSGVPYPGIDLKFYLVPKGADVPVFCCVDPPCVCPSLIVSGYESDNAQKFSVFIFTANPQGGDEKNLITYDWEVSAGRIIEGQGTHTIKVSPDGNQQITAIVTIGGLCDACPRTATFTAETDGKPQLIDDFGLETSDGIRYRMNQLLTMLNDNPTARGYVINYGGRTGRKFLRERKRQIADYFISRPTELQNRISIIESRLREGQETELWFSPDGNQMPVPTPTVDKRFVGVPAAPLSSARQAVK